MRPQSNSIHWTLNYSGGGSNRAIRIYNVATVAEAITNQVYYVYPSVYLKSGIECMNCRQEGAGSIDKPFELRVSN